MAFEIIFSVRFVMEVIEISNTILMQLSNLPKLDCLLITQSLDDHCHLKTLKPLSEILPNLRVIATPNAKPLLDPLFNNVSSLLFWLLSALLGCIMLLLKHGHNILCIYQDRLITLAYRFSKS